MVETANDPRTSNRLDELHVEAEFSTEQDNNNDTPHYPTGMKFAGTVLAICLSFVIIGLDSTIIAIAVPTMTRHFGTIADIGWYTSVYRLMAASFQFMFGKIYGSFTAKPVILFSLSIFAIGNLICALAPTSAVFIGGRAVTGLATAGTISGAFAMIIQTTPLQKRPMYAGIGGATEAVASLSAPLIGGLLTDSLSWRWCFYIELPLTAMALAMVFAFFHGPTVISRDTFTARIRALDLFGTALIIPCLTCLLLALQWGGNRYGWSSWRIILAITLFAALGLAFGWLQYSRGDQATLPPRIIMNRSVLSGFCFSCCNNGALSTIEYYMPIYFQVVRGFSASKAGIMVLPIAAGLIVSVLSSGYLMTLWGYYNPFMIATSVITPIASGLMTTYKVEAELWALIFFQVLLGSGAGIGFQGPQVAVQAILSEKDAQLGIAIIQFAQGMGPAIFIAAAQTIFQSRLASNLSEHAKETDLATLGGQGLTVNPQNPEYGGIVLSYNNAITDTFYLPVALACISLAGALCIEWSSVKTKKP